VTLRPLPGAPEFLDEPEGFHHRGFVVHRSPEAPRVATPDDPASPAHAPGLPFWSDEVIE